MALTQWSHSDGVIKEYGDDPMEILDRIAEKHGVNVELSAPERARTGGLFGWFAKEVWVVKGRRRLESLSPVSRFVNDTEDEVVLGGVEQAPAPAMDFEQLLESAASSMGRDPSAVPLPRLEAEPSPEDAGRRWVAVCELLGSAGLPAEMIPAQPPQGGESWIESIFDALPTPPPLPTVAGGLVAVVGLVEDRYSSVHSLRETVLSVAAAVGCPDDEVAVVADGPPDRRVPAGYFATSVEVAASFAPAWRRCHTGVVLVAGGRIGEDQEFARDVLKALRPSIVIAATSAVAKPEDAERFVVDIGGADALALMDARRTCSPAAVLSLGIPVMYLDAKEASSGEWASLVAELVASRW